MRLLLNTTLQQSDHHNAFDVAKKHKGPIYRSKHASLLAAIDRLEPPVDMGLKLAILSVTKTTVMV